MYWWCEAPEQGPAKSMHHGLEGCLTWHPCLQGLKDLALSMPAESACAIYSDASSTISWGAALGDRSKRGKQSDQAYTEGINWKLRWNGGHLLAPRRRGRTSLKVSRPSTGWLTAKRRRTPI